MESLDTLLARFSQKEARKGAWKQLTAKGELWQNLCRLVTEQASEETFERLRASLDEWRDFDFAQSQVDENRSQWEIASTLFDLAQRAAAQSPQVERSEIPIYRNERSEIPIYRGDSRLERAAFRDVEAWEWDAFCALRGAPREPIPNTSRSLSILLQHPANNKGSSIHQWQ